MSQRSIVKNIKRNTLYEGTLRGNKRGFAFLARRDGGQDLFIPHEGLNGAQHGDEVVCRLTVGDNAEVVRVLSRGVTRLVGTLCLGYGYAYLRPDDQSYYSNVRLGGWDPDWQEGQKALVDITEWTPKGPNGDVVKLLGFAGEKESEILSVLYAAGFSDSFPEEVEKAALQLKMGAPERDRDDLRSLLTITIDGEDARDFDDAISITRTPKGYDLWVHIADVSHFVTPGGEIDKEAYKRATSVYFPRKAYPMLPEVLCNGLCSLVPNQDRFALSCRMSFDREGNRKGVYLAKSVINSDYRMTYTKVQAMLDGDEVMLKEYAPIAGLVSEARELSRLLRAKRKERGSIDFVTQESKVLFDGDKILGVEGYHTTESNQLIEDFMIAANEAVAETLRDAGYPCAYRVHDLPDPDKLKALTAFAGCFGLAPHKRYLQADEIADFVRRTEDSPYATVVNQVAIRCMQKAEYSPRNIGHYGLGSECYCHFTSPIRRYPDLMVHRLVKRYLEDLEQAPPGEEPRMDRSIRKEIDQDLNKRCQHCSQMERAAEKAERDIVAYYMAVYMQEHVGQTYEAVVSGVTASMLFATLPNGIEGAVALDDLREGFYFDSLRFAVISERHSYRIGDVVKVRVEESNPKTHKIRFSLPDVKPKQAKLGDVARLHKGSPKGKARPQDHRKPKNHGRSGRGRRR